jgi:hypothetical protein
MKTVKVRAREGALVPHPSGRRGEFVGWRKARENETPEHVLGRTTVGLVRIASGVEVQATLDVTRAIARGELVEIKAGAKASTGSTPTAEV